MEKPVFSCLTCRLVLLGNTDKSGLFAAFVKHKLLCGIGGFVIVMTNAVCTLVFLSHNYHRHTHFFQHSVMERSENRSQEDNSVNTIASEKLQIFHFFLWVVGRVHKQKLIALLTEYLTYSLHLSCTALA